MERIYLTNKDNITNLEGSYVKLELSSGTIFERVEPRRLFPISKPNEYISFLDEANNEVAVAKEFKDLNENSKKALYNALEDYYLVPKILKIYSYEHKYGFYQFEVETNRGKKHIDVSTYKEIKIFPDNSVRIRDADDNRYIIEDYNKLDSNSKKLIFSFI